VAPQKALEVIGGSLQKQYERWQPKARYKLSLDPTVEDVKKLCISLRRNAKEERVLFHYNGHGVPRPTQNGEIWVFNRTYTQYIPLSIYDLQSWMGAPSIFVYDCSNAGIIVNSFNTFAEQHEAEQMAAQNQNRGSSPSGNQQGNSSPPSHQSFKNCIQLAACSAEQILPMNPDLPADLFTATLTTPIKTALKWFSLKSTSKMVPQTSYDMIQNIPGVLHDRRTMLGELNWIFTAITDTIAWNTLPRELFQTLFRQDLLVASLFRNFLLADRIMRSYDCTPQSSPALPPTFRHPFWSSWDLALDLALSQLPDVLAGKKQYANSPFFEEQLTAFQVWLEGSPDPQNPPEQLPIVLQVLLSQAHRIRALELLEKFLDIGPWAVNLALNVGIFPYVLKLLQSQALELRPFLVCIWAKILAVDYTCQVDIVRESADTYFLNALQDSTTVFGQFNCRTFAAFVLASIVYKFEQGQANALKGSLLSICLEQLHDSDPVLRKWMTICLGNLWLNYEDARWSGARDLAYEKLYTLLKDPVPEVRAATVYALGTFISSTLERTSQANDLDRSIAVHMIENVSNDMSPLVRMELVASLQWIIKLFENQFVDVCHREDFSCSKEIEKPSRESSLTRKGTVSAGSSQRIRTNSGNNLCLLASLPHSGSYSSLYLKLWQGLVTLSRDPFPDVALMGKKVVEYIRQIANDQMITIGRDVICEKGSSSGSNSYSLPPSPNTRNFNSYMNNSHSGSTARLNDSASSNASQQNREKIHKLRIPIVKTNLIEWEISSFARPLKYLVNHKGTMESDQFSSEMQMRKQRFERNAKVRKEATEQQRLAVFNNLKTQSFVGKTAMIPSIVKLHPYEQQIAVAYLDRIMLKDWGLDVSTTLSPIQLSSSNYTHQSATIQTTTNNISTGKKISVTSPSTTIRVTSMQFINAHDRGHVMAGYDDGSVRIWKNSDSQNKPNGNNGHLVTAFQAIDEPSSKSLRFYGLQTAWHQSTQTIIAAGESKIIRLWDAEKELKYLDISGGSDFPVTHISCAYNGIFATGK
jgi:regulator-associated protein of mTOR